MGIKQSKDIIEFDGEGNDHDVEAKNFKVNNKDKDDAFALNPIDFFLLSMDYHILNQCPDKKIEPFSFDGQYVAAKVVKVYDGDTIHVVFRPKGLNEWVRFRCRMIGYNSPEVRGPERENGGLAARDYLNSLIMGKNVVVRLFDFDKYGRPLADVYLPKTDVLNPKKNQYIHINDIMVKNGHGKIYMP